MNRFGKMCYTYLLGWKELDKWYYGYRGANSIEPELDLPKYLSSSKTVKDFIVQHGEPNIIRVHKLFNDKFSAKEHETKFLARVNAVRSPRWLNKHDGGPNWGVARFFTEQHKRKISQNKKGFKFSEQTRKKMSQSRKAYNKTQAGKAHTRYMNECRGQVWNKGIPMAQETKKKMSQKVKAKYADGYVSPTTGRKLSEEQKKKISDSRQKNPMIITDQYRKKLSQGAKRNWQKRRQKKLQQDSLN